MNVDIEDRVINIAKYIVKNNITIREAAKVFHISKSIIHRDLNERLPKIDPDLYDQVRNILDFNFSIKHLRGGIMTRLNHAKNKD